MSNATLKDIALRPQYRTNPLDPEGVVGDFYIPVLSVAKKYDRLSGFFSSASFSLASRGVAALIANGGKMRLICSPRLSDADASVLEAFVGHPQNSVLEKYWMENFSPEASSIEHDHISAFGWMLQSGMLEVRLAVPDNAIDSSTSMCHPKIGIVEDFQGNAISFSGSNNETASGWAINQEEFKVFSDWDQYGYYENDKSYFDAYWQNMMPGVKCFEVPQALKERLIERAVEFNRETYIARHCIERAKRHVVWRRLNLRDYQQEALRNWEKNDYRLMFEMATGSGKTRTAIACLNRMMEIEDQGCAIIAAPRLALCDQWKRETSGVLVKRTSEILASSTNPKWSDEFARVLSRMSLGTSRNRFVVVYTSHATASSGRFIELVNRCSANLPLMLIADEAHGLGAPQYQQALYAVAKYRVGLSATPSRLFDDVGTRLLVDYFGGESYVFSIGDALKAGFVSPYRYHPVIVKFTVLEQAEYENLTEKIRRLRSVYENDPDPEVYEKLEKALRDRALLIAAAEEKMPRLRSVLKNLASSAREFAIAFACPKNIDSVVSAYLELGIVARRYTAKESPVERAEILRQFETGECPVLVAMKCLDEGVDVPAAKCAVIVSSTVNPREYIQRIGRVIRRAPGKKYAEIYDFLVSECVHGNGIVERDLKRGLYIAQFADNATEALNILYGQNGGNL